VALGAVLLARQASVSGVSGLLKHASLTYTWFDDRGGQALRVAWTLSVEVAFYAFVPVLFLALRRLPSRRPARPVLGAGLLLLTVGVAARWVVTHGHPAAWVHVLPGALAPLSVGLLLALAATVERPSRLVVALRRSARHRARWYAAAAILLVVLAVAVPARPTAPAVVGPDSRFVQAMLETALALCLVLPAALGGARTAPPGPVRRALAGLGTISFGLYLWHVPVLDAFRFGVHRPEPLVAALAAAAALAVSIVLAAASWRLVERPILARVARGTGGGASVPVTPSAPPTSRYRGV
jgi:peptidoglycan/LPS O-acetylase OafA/YrhL